MLLLLGHLVVAQQPKPMWVVSAGIDYRQFPIDIENTGRGPLPASSYGEMTGDGFWKTLSVSGSIGLRKADGWEFSLVSYFRYNHNHYTEDPYKPDGASAFIFNKNAAGKSKLKLDLFLCAGKRFSLGHKGHSFLVTQAGAGFTNINSGTDIVYQRNLVAGTETAVYKGSYFHFGPSVSIGYQYKRFRFLVEAFMIEDPSKSGLTSVWSGAGLYYDLTLKRKRRTAGQVK